MYFLVKDGVVHLIYTRGKEQLRILIDKLQGADHIQDFRKEANHKFYHIFRVLMSIQRRLARRDNVHNVLSEEEGCIFSSTDEVD